MRRPKFLHLPRQLWRCRQGVTALEFGLLAPVFFLLFLGLLEVCLIMTKIVLAENAIRIAGRTAIVSSNTEQQIMEIVTKNSFGFINFNDQARNCVCISAYSSVSKFSQRTKSTGCGACASGDAATTTANAYLMYELFFDHRFVTPLGALARMASQVSGAGQNLNSLKFSTSTVVKNEPFAATPPPGP